jgi:hypothetical protein
MTIVNNVVNDIACVCLPDAPIDPATGLPTPTIYAFTAGGVSRIAQDGTVSNTATIAGLSGNVQSGWIDGNYVRATCQSTGAVITSLPTASVLPAGGASALNSYWNSEAFYNGTIPSVLAGDGKGIRNTLGGNLGISVIKSNPTSTVKSMVAYITNAYNSGWQVGDSRGAYLADTVAETITASGELVTNGTFAVDTAGWTAFSGATLASVSGELQITSNGTDNPQAHAAISGLVIGRMYAISHTARRGTCVSAVSVDVLGVVGGPATVSTTNVSLSFNFIATATSHTLTPYIHGAAANGETAYFDNISCKLASSDRSVKNTGLILNGTLTKAAVAAGAQLMAYSGFSAANYLEQPYNANQDYSTVGFDALIWAKVAATQTIQETLYCRDSPATGVSWRLYVNASGYLVATVFDGTTTRTATGTTSVRDGIFKLIEVSYLGGTVAITINGAAYASTTGAALLTLNNALATFRIGLDAQGGNPGTNVSVCLLRASATLASLDQIAQIYRDELPLFQANAQCTVDGTSSAISALAYDETSDMLQVGTAWGRSAFKGLLRVESEVSTVGAITSLSANQGSILTGGATTGRYYQPAMLLRDELRRSEEARQALGRVPVFFPFAAITSQTAFVLPKGYTTKAVYSAGLLKDAGGALDYVTSSDGYQETVTFAVAPGNTVRVQIMGVRNK